VLVSRFCAGRQDLFPAIGSTGADGEHMATQYGVIVPKSSYLDATKLGEEAVYVLQRQSAAAFPGNLLPRPGLLLNPWAQRKTTTEEQTAASGDAFASKSAAISRSGKDIRKRKKGYSRGYGGGGGGSSGGAAYHDFLAAPSVLLSNLRPGVDGVLEISQEAMRGTEAARALNSDGLSGPVYVTIVALDAFHGAMRGVDAVLSGAGAEEGLAVSGADSGRARARNSDDGSPSEDYRSPCYRNLALVESFNTRKHFVQMRQARVVRPG